MMELGEGGLPAMASNSRLENMAIFYGFNAILRETCILNEDITGLYYTFLSDLIFDIDSPTPYSEDGSHADEFDFLFRLTH